MAMWNRKDPTPPPPAPREEKRSHPVAPVSRETHKEVEQVNIGQSILIKGELTGNEDLTIDGRVEGSISLKDHHLTIGKNGRIDSLTGDIVAPRIIISDGARFKGTVDMDQGETASTKAAPSFEAKTPIAEKAAGTA